MNPANVIPDAILLMILISEQSALLSSNEQIAKPPLGTSTSSNVSLSIF
jgi:hypothetical protein